MSWRISRVLFKSSGNTHHDPELTFDFVWFVLVLLITYSVVFIDLREEREGGEGCESYRLSPSYLHDSSKLR